jgi:hypothetical protein
MSVWRFLQTWFASPRRNGPFDLGLADEIERLRQRVRDLEQGRDMDRMALADVRAEFAAYRRALADAAMRQYTEEQLRQFAQEEDETQCRTLDEFIGELEAVVKGKRDA